MHDRAPVVTEPFTEWVLSGQFVGGRPRWEDAGATFTADVGPFEERKLWLLNGAHSMLAYAGSLRGHVTVADAMRDATCRVWLEEWWDAASSHLSLPPADIAAYRAALTERFANPRMRHRLDQIAFDGSQKLPIRTLPTLRRELAAGRVASGATRPVAAWVCHLRGHGAVVIDARAVEVQPLAEGGDEHGQDAGRRNRSLEILLRRRMPGVVFERLDVGGDRDQRLGHRILVLSAPRRRDQK